MSLKELLLQNWPQKLISLILGLGLFVFVKNTQSQETVLALKLVAKNRPSYLIPLSRLDPSLEVRFKGDLTRLKSLDKDSLTASVDMRNAVQGLNDFPIQVMLPPEIEDFEVIPTTKFYRMMMDYPLERLIPVSLNLKGEPAQGYEISAKILTPPSLLVRGPTMILSNLHSLSLKPLEISGLKADLRTNLQLEIGKMNLEIMQETLIQVDLGVSAKIIERTLDSLEPRLIGLEPGLSIGYPEDFKGVRLSLGGSRGHLNGLDLETVYPLLSLSNLGPGEHQIALKAVFPPGLALNNLEPETLTVRLYKEDE